MKFQRKRVLITGASRGIGQQLAMDFAAEGAKVVVNYQASSEAAERVVSEIKAAGGEAYAAQCDIGQRAEVGAMFEEMETRFGGIDILVNNAGINRDAPFLEMTDEDWEAVMSTNLTGFFLCCQEAARRMVTGEGGSIVNISAVTTILARANSMNYIASKGAMNAMTRAMAVELGPKVTVNAIALGFVDSPLVREIFSKERLEEVESSLLTGRMGTFGEVSAMVQYLASEEAGFVTGQVVSLDGGQAVKLG